MLIAMLMHAANNVVSGEYVWLLFSGDDAEVLGWTRAVLWCVVALTVVALTRMRLGAPAEEQGRAPADHRGDSGPGEEPR